MTEATSPQPALRPAKDTTRTVGSCARERPHDARTDEVALVLAAWREENDPVRRANLAATLAATLATTLARTDDRAAATFILNDRACSDPIRAEVARATTDPERRHAAIAAIRDETLLLQLALGADDTHLRQLAAQRVRSPAGLRALADGVTRREFTIPSPDADAVRASLFVPRVLQQHLVEAPAVRGWSAQGTAAFIDISGFTRLSERLAKKGREGAEQITEAIGGSFDRILFLARENGGSLLKFGGDALLLWFESDEHLARACRATVLMRRVLRDVGRIALPGAKVTLRMSQGVHSGRFHFFAVGTSEIELLPVGPGWSRLVAMEHAAQANDILLSPEAAAMLPTRCHGAQKGPGVLLRREPAGMRLQPLAPRPNLSVETLARCLSPAIRAHVLRGATPSEHRPVTIAFVRFEGLDALIAQGGEEAVAEALQRVVSTVETAAEEQDICFLGSDLDADGGKLILTAGAPRVTGDDEERMLLALRRIVEADLPIPVRIGVHRGSVFAGEIGPRYRRTYTVMGDAVNLAARLMARAPSGEIYSTAEVLDRSNTIFAATRLPPFAVKGKVRPVEAWSVGRAAGSRTRHVALQPLPLIGRDAEVQRLRAWLADARSGTGRLVSITGEGGVGKSRLLDALRDEAADFRTLHAACEAYTRSVPYVAWRELLRELLAIGRDDPDVEVIDRLRGVIATHMPDAEPWLPLLAGAFDVQLPATPEVQLLAEKNRRPKLHEVVARFLEAMLPNPSLIAIDDAQHMDSASAELLAYIAAGLERRPWVIAVARRPAAAGFMAPDVGCVEAMPLAPLAPMEALRMAQLATEQHPLQRHVLEVVTRRAGGNPQFLRDLLRAALESGGIGGLPDSAEAAAMARIDALAPEDRAVVRQAAVFGLTFHPRMMEWFKEDAGDAEPAVGTWERLQDVFEDDGEGYLRFRRSLLRDAAYEGLAYKVRRRLHGTVARHLEEEMEYPEEAAAILSLHYAEAGDHVRTFQYAELAARRAEALYAYVEAAELFGRALDAARRIPDTMRTQGATIIEAQADCWHRAAEFDKAKHGYALAHRFAAGDLLGEARIRLKRARLEERLGRYAQARSWTARARRAVEHLGGPEAARQRAQASSWYATMLHAQGRSRDALRWAERAAAEATAADESEALGAAYFVMSASHAMLGKDDAEALMKRALDAYRQSGNLARQASLLANLGVMCQWQGRWDEAMDYYERGRAESLKLGDTVNAALAHINVAEILIDRGELETAEALLRDTLPLWKASRYRFYLGACLSLLGRVALRAGRFAEALSRLDEARANFAQVSAEQELPAIDARIAECRVFMREPDAALAITEALLGRSGHRTGVIDVTPLLERVRGFAHLQRGEPVAARRAFDASLAAARAKNDLGEVAFALRSLVELARRQAEQPSPELLAETQALLRELRIEAPAALPPI